MFSLLDQSFTTCHVRFDANASPKTRAKRLSDLPGASPIQQPPRWADPDTDTSNGRDYCYKVPKSWDLQAGDHAVVIGRNGCLAVVLVTRVDALPDIDVDADFNYKWLVSKVDLTEHDALVEREKSFSDTMLEIERVKQRESLVASFRDSLPEGSEARRLFEQTTGTLTAPVVEGQVNG
jgi:hypothetical protein